MEKKINILQYAAMVLSLGIVAGSLVANHQLSQCLADGNTTQLAQLGPAARLGSTGVSPVNLARRTAGTAVLREITPRVPNMVHIVARHADGTVFYDQTVHNLRTNAGINWQYSQMAGTAAAACTYLALSNDSGTPAVTDTAVASEITANGLARVNATPAHAANAASYTLSYTFTATGTQSAQKAGLLNASGGGTLCFENTFSAVAMNSGDTLQVVWSVNF